MAKRKGCLLEHPKRERKVKRCAEETNWTFVYLPAKQETGSVTRVLEARSNQVKYLYLYVKFDKREHINQFLVCLCAWSLLYIIMMSCRFFQRMMIYYQLLLKSLYKLQKRATANKSFARVRFKNNWWHNIKLNGKSTS